MGTSPVEQNPFQKWVKSDSQSDFLQLVDYSSGKIAGWIDAAGIRQGSLAGGGGITASSPDWLNVKNFGAVGNGVFIAGGSMTSGSPILNTDVSSFPENQFNSGMVGQNIMVQNAGINGADLWTTVLSYQNSGQVTLAANAGTSVPLNTSANIIVGGTDDTNAIQAAITAGALANVPVYIPTGVYLISAPLVYTATTVFVPPAIYGDGSFCSILAWRNPAVVGASTGTFNFGFNVNPFSMRGLAIFGNSLPTGITPTAGSEVMLRGIAVGPIADVVVQTTKFLHGLNIRITSGEVEKTYDSAQSLMELDGSTAKTCTASAFLLGSDSPGDLAGTVENCLALGDFPVEACFLFEHGQEDSNGPITFTNCYSVGGAFSAVIPVGFKTRGSVLINCSAALSLIPFWADVSQSTPYPEIQKLLNCTSLGLGNVAPGIASCVVGSFIPWVANVPLTLGWKTIDASGHVQKVTTAGTAGGSTPSWNDSGGVTNDGTAAWTDQGAYSPTGAGAVIRIENFSVANQLANNTPYGVWKTAKQRLLLEYDGVSTNNSFGSAPVVLTNLSGTLSASDLLPQIQSVAQDVQGLYTIKYYLECTTAGSGGTATPTFTWVDENGTQTVNGSSLPLNGVGYESGSIIVRAVGKIQASVTVAGATGSPKYAFFAAAKQDA